MATSSLSSLLRQAFPQSVRSRGKAYARQGRVDLLEAGSDGLRAEVHGSLLYQVEVEVDAEHDHWLPSCECPAFMEEGPCKHVWAAILVAEPVIQANEDERNSVPEFDGTEPGEAGVLPFEPVEAEAAPRTRIPTWQRRLTRLLSERDRSSSQVLAEGAKQLDLRWNIELELTAIDGSLWLRLEHRRRGKRGAWGKWRELLTTERTRSFNFAASEERALALVRGASRSGLGSRNTHYGPFEVPATSAELVLRELCALGDVRWVDMDVQAPAPLSFQEGEPWKFALRAAPLAVEQVKASDHGREDWLSVDGVLVRDGLECPVSEPRFIYQGGLVFFEDSIGVIDACGAWELVGSLYEGGALEAPVDQRHDFLERLSWLAGSAELRGLSGGQISRPEPQPHLEVTASEGSEEEGLSCELTFEYGSSLSVPLKDPRGWFSLSGETVVLRDFVAEGLAMDVFYDNGGRPPSGPAHDDASVTRENFAKLVRALLTAGWTVRAEGKVHRLADRTKLSVSSDIDWLDVHGDVVFDGESVPLPSVLSAVKEERETILLGDGTFGVLPEEWLGQFELMNELGVPAKEGLRFCSSQGSLVDALLEEKGAVDVDAGFANLREKLSHFTGVHLSQEPPGFRGELRPYQREGLGWLEFLVKQGFGGCLADDMGLGKTIQVLALLESRRARGRAEAPSLVVAPKSLTFNWLDEARKFTPELRLLDYTGPGRKDALRRHLGPSGSEDGASAATVDLIVTTHGTVRRDIEELKDVRFDMVVLDEAQAIKNSSSQTSRSVRLLRSSHRLALTGTPIENRLSELWSLFDFLNPGLLGQSSTFKSLSNARSNDLDEERRRTFARALRPFILRRTKAEVLDDLPDKTEQVLYCELEGPQRSEYDRVRQHYRSRLLGTKAAGESGAFEGGRIEVLEALLRLRQLACHPGLVDPKNMAADSAKLDVLLPLLREVKEGGHGGLVFSQFTSLLAILRAKLDAEGIRYEYLDGATRNREEKVKRFQTDPDCPLFLISLKAGGYGLNLTAADYVFLLDPWWNPAVEAQAVDRAHRMGQTRVVNAYRLIARGTIEEKVLDLQERKRELADAVLGGDKSASGMALRDLTRSDLESLLS